MYKTKTTSEGGCHESGDSYRLAVFNIFGDANVESLICLGE